jgi:hypothetical protein
MQQTSNPTPPERSDVKKTKMTGSQLPVKSPSNIQLVDVNVNREINFEITLQNFKVHFSMNLALYHHC